MINISIDVDEKFGKKEIFTDAHVAISNKNKYGLIGLNGAGKTTLLKKILDIPNIDVYMVSQSIPDTDKSVYDVLIETNKIHFEAVKEHEKILNDLEDESCDTTDILDKLQEADEKILSLGVQQDESKIRKILTGLGFTRQQQSLPVAYFSGGWRMRIALACALYMEPGLLLLDEPTNHLDLEAVIWLTNYLNEWEKTLVVVSHNTDFLDNICTHIMNIENKKLKIYEGNYSKFQKMYNVMVSTYEKDKEKLDKLLQKMKKKSMPGEVMKKAIKDAGLVEMELPPRIIIEFENNSFGDKNIVKLEDVCFGYDGEKILFEDVSFVVTTNSRITFVGRNGCGKTTLTKLLVGQLDPQSGRVYINDNIRIGYFDQHSIQQLNSETTNCLTPISYIQAISNLQQQDIRCMLGRCGLESAVHTSKLETLSGGQLMRVALIALRVKKPHLIVLDEPTNHLDLYSIRALINGINDFDGAVIIISHDATLIEDTNCKMYVVKDNTVKETSYTDYCKEILMESM